MASARDVALAMVLVFAFGILFFIVNFATKSITSRIVQIPVINQSSPAAVKAFGDMDKSLDRLDYMSLGIFIGLVFAIIITGYYVGGQPLFIFFYFIVTGIATFVAMGLANFWYDLSNSSVFGTTLNSFPITNHLLTNLPLYTIGLGILGMVVMFAKPYVQGVFQ